MPGQTARCRPQERSRDRGGSDSRSAESWSAGCFREKGTGVWTPPPRGSSSAGRRDRPPPRCRAGDLPAPPCALLCENPPEDLRLTAQGRVLPFGGGHGLDAAKRARNANSQLALASRRDRKSTRLNSSHRCISYAVFCLKKKK